MKISKLAKMFLISFFTLSAVADISLSDVVINFDNESDLRRDIWVTNHGKQRTFLEITPFHVTNPGDDKLKKSKIIDPRNAKIVVSPAKMILEAGKKKAIRIILNDLKRENEEIYRIKVVPKLGKVNLRGEVTEGAKRTGLKVVVGYEVLTIIRPKNLIEKYDIKRNGKNIVVKNLGNTSFLIDEITQCENFDSNINCQVIKGPRVYPNKTVTTKIRPGLETRLYLKLSNETKTLSVK